MGKQKKNRQGAAKTFEKKKVKVGRKIPKAANATNTSFKTRTIQIIQQLNKDEEEATTKRKVGIKELFSQCQHYNVTMRLGAAKGLREILLLSSDTVISHLGLTLDRAGSLLTDKDKNVRESVQKLFQSLFEVVAPSRMSPFFPALCAHLCCAMTHIDADIQEDSLSMFDLILDTYPQLIIQGSNQLLSNFVEQISKQKFKYKKSEVESLQATKFTLSVTPNSRMSSQKWQTKVLSRLYKLLAIVLLPGKLDEEGKGDKEIVFEEGKTYSNLYPEHIKSCWHSAGFVVKSSGLGTNSSGILEDSSSINFLLSSLFPLMMQCWVEAHDSEKNDGSILYPDALLMRTTVLKIALLLMEYGERHSDSVEVSWKDWMSEQYEESLRKHFLSHFPFDVHQNKKKKKQNQGSVKASPETLNALICSVMIKFIKNPLEGFETQPWVQEILEYLGSLIQSPDMNLDNRRHMLQVLNELLKVVGNDDRLALLSACLSRYNLAHVLSQERQMFLDFFSGIIFEESDSENLCEPLVSFLKSLPNHLLKYEPTHTKILTKMLSVIKKGVEFNITPLITKLQAIINDVFSIDKGIFLKADPSVQKTLIETLYWLSVINPSQSRVLSQVIINDSLGVNLAKYFIEVLHNRYLKTPCRLDVDPDKISDHLGFLLLIMTGNTNFTNFDSVMDTDQGQATLIDWTKGDNWLRQLELNGLVCRILATDFMDFSSLVLDIVWTNLERKINMARESGYYSVSLVLNFMSTVEQFLDKTNTKEIFTDFLIDISKDLSLIQNGHSHISANDELVVKLLQILENILLNKDYLNVFIESTQKRILSLSEESSVLSLSQMLASCLSRKPVQVAILEKSTEERKKYGEGLNQLVDFVEGSFKQVTSESWWSNLVYFVDLLT